MADSFTPAKGLILMQTGGDIGTWGSNLNNDAISVIDNNLGGTLTLSVAGGTNVTLSSSQVENLYYNFTGVLTGNIEVIWPTGSGFYIIANNTTGAFTLTVQPTGGTGIVLAQGSVSEVLISTNTGTAFLTNNVFATSASPTFTGTITGVNETLSGTLAVTGDTTLTGTLGVTGSATFDGGINFSTLTASELVATDASNNLTNTTSLPNGTTATTQSSGDDSTKVATTAYVDPQKNFNLAAVTSNGSFTTPSNINTNTVFKITLVGGGGGGGGVNGPYTGSGGGAGGAVTFYIGGLSPSTNYTATIGSAGSSGVVGNGGNGGATSIVIGSNTYSASGGSGGNGTGTPTTAITANQGSISLPGSPPSYSYYQSRSSGALISSSGFSPPGGGTQWGSGGIGGTAGEFGMGQDGNGFGAGGGGGLGSSAPGGSGSGGIIYIEWVF